MVGTRIVGTAPASAHTTPVTTRSRRSGLALGVFTGFAAGVASSARIASPSAAHGSDGGNAVAIAPCCHSSPSVTCTRWTKADAIAIGVGLKSTPCVDTACTCGIQMIAHTAIDSASDYAARIVFVHESCARRSRSTATIGVSSTVSLDRSASRNGAAARRRRPWE